MKFRATILSAGRTAAGIQIPDEIVESLGAGKKPPVTVTINGHTYRSTIASRGGRFLVGVSAENRAAARVAAGDEVDVRLELDTAPREVAVPADLARAIRADRDVSAHFEGLSYSKKRAFVVSVEGAKTPETRQRRIDKAVAALREGA